MNGGVETTRASAVVTINTSTDYNARGISDGQTIDFFLDGGNKACYESAVLNETETLHGIRGNNANATFQFDNFTVFARDDGYSQLDKWTK